MLVHASQLVLVLLISSVAAARAIRMGPDGEEMPAALTSLADYENALGAGRTSQAGQSTRSYGRDFVEHFSAQTTETATYLYNLYKPSPNSSALAYSVTSARSTSIYNYLFAAENKEHVTVQAIDEDSITTYKAYFPSGRKRLAGGNLALDIKYAGWRIDWRGVDLEVYATNWVEATYQKRSQTHIIVRSLPQAWDPAKIFPEQYEKIASAQQSHSTIGESSEQKTADQAISLFLLEVGDYNARIKDVVLVFEQSEWREDAELWENIQKADWKDVILDPEMKASLKHEYKSFFASEKVYKDLGVPWKRGVIFLGPPGNGKTISLKAMMKDAGVSLLYVKSLHTYGGDELGIRMVFERARQEAPCLLVFEDLDSLITDNNRSFFLNEIDGLEDNDGLLLIGTTNHFDKLDTALSNRPSRFDRKYFFPNPTQDERTSYAQYWRTKLASNPKIKFPESLIAEYAEKTHGFSFAYLKEVFVSTLLTLAAAEEKLDFPTVLMQQVAALRKDLDSDKGEKRKGHSSRIPSDRGDNERKSICGLTMQSLPQRIFNEVDADIREF